MSRRGWPARPCMQLPLPTCRRPRRVRESARAIDLAVYCSALARRARSSGQHMHFSSTAPPAGPYWACLIDLRGAWRPSSPTRPTDMVVLFFRRNVRDLSPRAGGASRGAILVPRVRCSAALRQRARLIFHLRPLSEWHILRVRPASSVPRAAGSAWEERSRRGWLGCQAAFRARFFTRALSLDSPELLWRLPGRHVAGPTRAGNALYRQYANMIYNIYISSNQL